ncbi:substrate-binding periplasmic protein [Zooshikella sp. RANM57]|uniref:substrate-binding periplasmic protein n=1 Tax=Zooshikella sp. RANM57 TaxID=3425863 RepID=UPI003D6FC3AD
MKLHTLVFLALVSSSVTFAAGAETNEVSVLISSNDVSEPFGFGGQSKGVIADTYKAIFKDTGVNTLIVPMPDQRIKNHIIKGTYKNWLSWGGMSWFRNSKNIYYSKQHLFVSNDIIVFNAKPTANKITTNALNDLRLGKISGFYYRWINQNTITNIATVESAFSALHRDRIDCFLFAYPRIEYYFAKYPNIARGLKYDYITNLNEEKIFLIFDQKLPLKIKSLIDTQLVKLISDGTIASIFNKYHLPYTQ